jgi:hypothetical protein
VKHPQFAWAGCIAVAALACVVGCGGEAFVFARDAGDELADVHEVLDAGDELADVHEDVHQVLDAGNKLAAIDAAPAEGLEDVQTHDASDELAIDVDAGPPDVDASDAGPPVTCVSAYPCSNPRPVECVYGSSYECCSGPCPK